MRRPGAEGEEVSGEERRLRPRAVLFLCVANSARSQIAEGIARSLSPAGMTVHSASSAPGTVHPLAIRVMREIGIDITSHRSKGTDEVPLQEIDTVITLCAEEACPVIPHPARRLHWGLPDPAAVEGTEEERLAAFRAVRDALHSRIQGMFEP
jgi:arsenate reductase